MRDFYIFTLYTSADPQGKLRECVCLCNTWVRENYRRKQNTVCSGLVWRPSVRKDFSVAHDIRFGSRTWTRAQQVGNTKYYQRPPKMGRKNYVETDRQLTHSRDLELISRHLSVSLFARTRSSHPPTTTMTKRTRPDDTRFL